MSDPRPRLNTLLDVRSYFTPGGGVCSPTTLSREATRRGFSGLGLTDDTGTAGSVELWKAARAEHLNPVIGTTLRVSLPGGTFPLRLLAGSRAGFTGINELLTLALGR